MAGLVIEMEEIARMGMLSTLVDSALLSEERVLPRRECNQRGFVTVQYAGVRIEAAPASRSFESCSDSADTNSIASSGESLRPDQSGW